MRDETKGRLTGRLLTTTRLRIWAKNPCCAMCGKLVDYPGGFELDHVVPLFKGGGNEDENLQILCSSSPGDPAARGCHALKTEADMGHKPKPKYDEDGRVIWDRE